MLREEPPEVQEEVETYRREDVHSEDEVEEWLDGESDDAEKKRVAMAKSFQRYVFNYVRTSVSS